MAMNKIDRINREIEKTREKITEYQNKLKGLEAQKTEAENCNSSDNPLVIFLKSDEFFQ